MQGLTRKRNWRSWKKHFSWDTKRYEVSPDKHCFRCLTKKQGVIQWSLHWYGQMMVAFLHLMIQTEQAITAPVLHRNDCLRFQFIDQRGDAGIGQTAPAKMAKVRKVPKGLNKISSPSATPMIANTSSRLDFFSRSARYRSFRLNIRIKAPTIKWIMPSKKVGLMSIHIIGVSSTWK